MSRVLFVSLQEDTVVSRCEAANVGISTIESLPAGGVRLVCMSSDGADSMRKKLKGNLISADAPRQAYRPTAPTW